MCIGQVELKIDEKKGRLAPFSLLGPLQPAWPGCRSTGTSTTAHNDADEQNEH